jgi:hypothetical protein
MYDKTVMADWTLYKPFVQRIYNSEVNESIGAAPAQIIFGNAIHLSRGILASHTINPQYMSGSTWTANMLKAQAHVIELAQKHQLLKDIRHIQTASTARTEFPINSYVLLDYVKDGLRNKSAGPTKLHTSRQGPYKVVNVDHTRQTYTIQNMVTGKTDSHHVKFLRPFNYDPEHHNIKAIAMKDAMMQVLEKIVSHTGSAKQKSHMTFTCKWEGLPETFTSVETWARLKKEPILHDYLYSNNLRTAIPSKYKSGTATRFQEKRNESRKG